MKRKFIKWGIISFIIIFTITMGIALSGRSKSKVINVKAANAKIQNINATVTASGIVEESDKEEIYFDTAVKVSNLLVEKDSTVTKGQKLVVFDMDDIYSQLNQAKISLNIQKLTLDKIESSTKTQIDNQTGATLEQSKNAMELAKANFERTEKLYNEGSASLVEYQNSKVSYENADLQYTAAQNSSNDFIEGSSKDIENQKNQIKLTELKINDMQTKIDKLLAQSISPIDGVVTELNISKGAMANPAVMAIKIINPDFLRVRLEVKEVDMLKIKENQTVQVSGDAFPDKKLNGVVKSIGTVAVKKQGVSSSDEAFIKVMVSVDNTSKILKPGISVNAEVITDIRNNAVTIPFNGFQEDKNGKRWVFIIEGNTVKQVVVTTGISSKLDLEIVSGLKGDEKIVEDPPSNLKDGSKITIISS